MNATPSLEFQTPNAGNLIEVLGQINEVALAVAADGSLQPLTALLRQISGFDLAVISTVFTDGSKVFQKANTVAVSEQSPVKLEPGAVWAWEESACCNTVYGPDEYVSNYSACFPDSIWAGRNLQGFVSMPVFDSSNRVSGTVIVGDFSGKALEPGAMELLQMCKLVVQSAIQRGFELLPANRAASLEVELREAHGQAVNTLAATLGWIERAQQHNLSQEDQNADLDRALTRLETLRLHINEMLAISTTQSL